MPEILLTVRDGDTMVFSHVYARRGDHCVWGDARYHGVGGVKPHHVVQLTLVGQGAIAFRHGDWMLFNKALKGLAGDPWYAVYSKMLDVADLRRVLANAGVQELPHA